MAEARIHFGTDGWRGAIAEDYTFASVRRCTQGFASFLLKRGYAGKRVVVGYDRRFDSEHFAACAAEVLAANGLNVLLTQTATPTPAIAYAVVHSQAAGAVNITASHNPASDNGFKVRDEHGGAIDPAGLKEIESSIPTEDEGVQRISLELAFKDGSVELLDAAPAYTEQLNRMVDLGRIRTAGLKVVFDPMWGNGAGWLPMLLAGGATQVVQIHGERNPIFPEMERPEPIRPNIDVGLRRVREEKADALLVTDGDADRVGFGDENGEFINQLQVYGLLALYLLEVRGLRGPIVKTLSTTSMLEKLGARYGVPVYQTGVGFKYVAPKMLETDALIGGEESGGFAFRGHVPERDGLLAGLFLLDMMVSLGKKPSELVSALYEKVGGAYYYERVDWPLNQAIRDEVVKKVASANPTTLAGLRVLDRLTFDGFKYLLEDGGWLLVRFSGTEPIVRVYCETMRQEKVQRLLEEGTRLVGLEP
ncbi:MAG: phosphoglucomutase/phosphomannomutase family protein [Anaerolineales bacterium]|jgi:alpha-D-glucose phosphate-specific phosphoglucomutase